MKKFFFDTLSIVICFVVSAIIAFSIDDMLDVAEIRIKGAGLLCFVVCFFASVRKLIPFMRKEYVDN